MTIDDRIETAGLARVPPSEAIAAIGLADEQAAAVRAFPSVCPRIDPPVDAGPVCLVERGPAGPDPRGGTAEGRRSITRIVQAYAAGTLTPPALLDSVLDRIDAIDDGLHSFVAIDRRGSRTAAAASARRWAAGASLGPLDGVPVGVKDVIDVAGLPTRCHSRLTSDAPAMCDAAVVARLRAGGAVILGKLATHEFAIGGPAFDLPFPPARNPWNRGHHPGGSSSGAGAAVAAGLVPLAIGTDTAGSVRNPASACGVVGLKPGRGVLPLDGVVPLAWTLDHVGLLTGSVGDMALAAAALGIDAAAGEIGRVGYVRHFHARDMAASAEMSAALDRAAAALGAVEVTLPPLGDFALVNRVILQSEGFAFHAADLRRRPELYSALTRKALLAGAFTTAETLALAHRRRIALTAAVNTAFERVDILLTASGMEPACRIDDPPEIARSYMLQARTPFNVTGHPALAMAAGLSAAGLPLSVQFAGRMGDEGRLITVAAAWEAAMGGPVFPPIGCGTRGSSPPRLRAARSPDNARFPGSRGVRPGAAPR